MDTKTPTVARKNTSVNVREDLWARLKIAAIRHKVTVSDAFEDALEQWLRKKAA